MKRSTKILYWVIMVGLSGILVKPVESLLSNIPWSGMFNSNNWKWLMEPRISILSIFVGLIILVIIVFLSRRIISKLIGNQEERFVDKLKQFNKIIDEENNVKITWDVGMDSIYNHDPFPYNIRVFCLNHNDLPLQMMNGHCPDPNCPNNQKFFHKHILKNSIESMLLQQWEVIKDESKRK